MAKTKAQKSQLLAQYEQYLREAKAVYLASMNLTANETVELKRRLKNHDAVYTVIKNTLFRIAVQNTLNKEIDLKGPISAVTVKGDIVEVAKELAKLKKEDKAHFISMILDGNIDDGTKIDQISKLESKEQLLGKLMYLLNYPTAGLARALANNIQKLLYALNAVKNLK
ncbi:MAG: 50S ribosomal protein L10 [Candidatus Dojkabacteria bacterium]|nr:MAG: 50S ribosomal protein L10 [Candidatus Dojkabacteria bacterium]